MGYRRVSLQLLLCPCHRISFSLLKINKQNTDWVKQTLFNWADCGSSGSKFSTPVVQWPSFLLRQYMNGKKKQLNIRTPILISGIWVSSAFKALTSICCDRATAGDNKLVLVEGLLIIKQSWVETGPGSRANFHKDCKLWSKKSPKKH